MISQSPELSGPCRPMTHSHITDNLDLLNIYKCAHNKRIISLYYGLSTFSEIVTLWWEPHIQKYGSVSRFVCTFIAELTSWKLQDLALANYNRHRQCSTYLGIFIKGRHLTTPISGFSLVSSFSARLNTTLLGPATLSVLCSCCANCPTTALQSTATADMWGTYVTHSNNNTPMLICAYQKINTAQIHQMDFW